MQTNNSVLPHTDPYVMKLGMVIKCLQIYFVPLVVSLGLCGCVLACVVFLKSGLRYKFFAQFLVAVSISNIGFLTTVIFTWLFEQGLDVYSAPGLCQVVVFCSHFFPFLTFGSSLLGAYLIIWDTLKPRSLPWIHSASVSKSIIIGVALLSFTLYSYKTWTNGSRLIMGYRVCTVLKENETTMQILNILDVVLLLILPSLTFFLFDAVLITTRVCELMQLIKVKKLHRNHEVLKIVLSHSICYHALVTPRAISMLILIIDRLSYNRFPNLSDIMFHKLFQFLFYTYFAVLPILPLFVSVRFRRGLLEILGLRRRRRRIGRSINQPSIL